MLHINTIFTINGERDPSRTMGPLYPNKIVRLSLLFTHTLALGRGTPLNYKLAYRPLFCSFLSLVAHNLDQLQPSIVVPVEPKVIASKAVYLTIRFAIVAICKASSHFTSFHCDNTQNGGLSGPYGLEI